MGQRISAASRRNREAIRPGFNPATLDSQEILEYVEVLYNRQRHYSTLGYDSPVEFEVRTAVVYPEVHGIKRGAVCLAHQHFSESLRLDPRPRTNRTG